jgi:glycosyltransferase involved in cell wall biosynthesis
MPPVRVSVVIPVHNEASVLEDNVHKIIGGLEKSPVEWDLWLVENGSTDKTPEIARRLASTDSRIRVLELAEPSYGKAMQLGLLTATGDVLVNFDIDYWDIKFVEVAAHVVQVRYDIVIASKNLLLSQDRRGWIRRIASYAFRMILFFGFGLRVSDTHGIKAWRNTSTMRAHFQQSTPSHHTYDTEIVIRAMRQDAKVLEVPIEVIETRASDRRLMKRVPQAMQEIVKLYWRLRRDRQDG